MNIQFLVIVAFIYWDQRFHPGPNVEADMLLQKAFTFDKFTFFSEKKNFIEKNLNFIKKFLNMLL